MKAMPPRAWRTLTALLLAPSMLSCDPVRVGSADIPGAASTASCLLEMAVPGVERSRTSALEVSYSSTQQGSAGIDLVCGPTGCELLWTWIGERVDCQRHIAAVAPPVRAVLGAAQETCGVSLSAVRCQPAENPCGFCP